ncbi:MAG: DUF4232 domain-containing protein, partial [Solirubrobacteraceae bacterium]|nr:DUF4232 domain-containing protein [Solirubrobacteraceae bacterium]
MTSGQGCGAAVRWAGSSAGTGVIFGHFSVAASPGHVCRFRGLPTVTLLDQAGKARPTRAARDTLVTPVAAYETTVAIRSGHPASFSLIYSDHLPSGRACRQAFGIDVRLPGQDVDARVPVSPSGARG